MAGWHGSVSIHRYAVFTSMSFLHDWSLRELLLPEADIIVCVLVNNALAPNRNLPLRRLQFFACPKRPIR